MSEGKEDRLMKIEAILSEATQPMSGRQLATVLGVSRQVIVQDIDLLRARDLPIESNYKGYIMKKDPAYKRVFKVAHEDDQIEEELNLIVDLGATVDDVFIHHRVYEEIRATMHIKSRKDVQNFMEKLHSSVSSPLKNITNNYHYHTVSADDEETLDQVEAMLGSRGFLAEKEANEL